MVVGSTGLVGGEICRRLREGEEDVRAFVRKTSDPGRVQRLRDLGCEIVEGDLQNRKSLDRACEGAWSVISTATTMSSRQPHDTLTKTDLEGQLSLIDAAERHDVKRFVLISVSSNLEGPTTLHKAKRKVEEKLRESGIAYTILKASCFMEIWLSPYFGFDAAGRKARILGAGDKPISFVSLYDVAEIAVQSLDGDAAANHTFDVGGPEALTAAQVVKTFERLSGDRFDVVHVPQHVLEQQHDAATDDYEKTFAGLAVGICGGDEIDMTDVLRRFPVKLRSIEDFARETLARA
ncbi:MAG TPA: SDR family oxidoreductase [Thermoanaerobaculia bacterium]|nr:SDR family oxidoreductase [Thermoanaerobaculia bacterium]